MLRVTSQEGRSPASEARLLCLKIRKARQWTQGQLANALGVKRKVVENIEQSRYDTVPQTLLEKIMEVGNA